MDVVVAPSFNVEIQKTANVTSHPAVVVPDEFVPFKEKLESSRRTASGIMFVSWLSGDDLCLAVAHAFQRASDFHLR